MTTTPQRTPMLPANAYVIRLAGDHDDDHLDRIAELDSAEPLEHPVLLGEIDGRPEAAIDLDTGRIIANPFVSTEPLLVHLRMRAAALDAYVREPSVGRRIRAAIVPRRPRWAGA
jgi:hypothetical protein